MLEPRENPGPWPPFIPGGNCDAPIPRKASPRNSPTVPPTAYCPPSVVPMRARSGSLPNECLPIVAFSNAALPPIRMEEGAMLCPAGPGREAIDISEFADNRCPESMAALPGDNDMLVIA